MSTLMNASRSAPFTGAYTGNTLPTPAGAGHQQTESTTTGCNRWLSLAEIALKVPLASRNRSLVANTSRCGEGISVGGL
jgi:hypothetical protein